MQFFTTTLFKFNLGLRIYALWQRSFKWSFFEIVLLGFPKELFEIRFAYTQNPNNPSNSFRKSCFRSVGLMTQCLGLLLTTFRRRRRIANFRKKPLYCRHNNGEWINFTFTFFSSSSLMVLINAAAVWNDQWARDLEIAKVPTYFYILRQEVEDVRNFF